VADLASIAAAQTAGYKEIVNDKGASYGADRFFVTLEKHLTGDVGQTGAPWRAYGQGATQAAAETQALAGLNKQRFHRYGGSTSSGTGSNGGTINLDVN
jgi:hypothetical protein